MKDSFIDKMEDFVESTCSFVCLDAILLIQLIEGHYGDGLVAFVVVATSVSD